MTRRSARIASSSQPDSSPSNSQSSPAAAGTKRKAEPGSSPIAKRGKKDGKEQKTIEESMDLDTNDSDPPKSRDSKTEESSAPPKAEPPQNTGEKMDDLPEAAADKKNGSTQGDQANGHKDNQNGVASKEDEKPEVAEEVGTASDPKSASVGSTDKPADELKEELNEEPKEQQSSTADKSSAGVSDGDDAVEAHARDEKVPSSILEKGIMYFVYRGRVNIEDPKNVQDLQRSFLILRPLPHGAKLSDGPIGDDKNCRLIAIPKKMLPVSGNDKWTAFVETANTSFPELKDNFLKSNDYTTQTGSSHTPTVKPAAEGVYAITTTGRETHLAYILTIPEDIGSLQNDLGLRSQGSFVTSVKNPKAPGPANADIGRDPGYSQELQNEFRSLRWAPLKPDHLNYEGCQFLMIGEGEQGLDKATEVQAGDENKDETPMEELQKLEGEDELRVEHLNGDDAVFADLGTNAKDYPKLQTTW